MDVTRDDLKQAAACATELSEQAREHPENARLEQDASEAWDRWMHLCERWHGGQPGQGE